MFVDLAFAIVDILLHNFRKSMKKKQLICNYIMNNNEEFFTKQ